MATGSHVIHRLRRGRKQHRCERLPPATVPRRFTPPRSPHMVLRKSRLLHVGDEHGVLAVFGMGVGGQHGSKVRVRESSRPHEPAQGIRSHATVEQTCCALTATGRPAASYVLMVLRYRTLGCEVEKQAARGCGAPGLVAQRRIQRKRGARVRTLLSRTCAPFMDDFSSSVIRLSLPSSVWTAST